MTSQASTSISGRPIALTVLWIVLMAPLSLTGTALQPHTTVPARRLSTALGAGPLAVAMFHAVVNITLALTGDPQASLRSFAVLALATGVAAVIAVPLGRAVGLGNLGVSRMPRAPKN